MSNDLDLFEKELSSAQTYPEELNHLAHRLEQRIKKEHGRKKTFYGSMTMMAASLFFILLVNTSTSFVYAVSEIPILNRISQMLLFDESVKSALENDYIQYVGLSETQGETTLKLPYVIADERNLLLFFQTNEKQLAPGEMYEVDFTSFRDKNTGKIYSQGFISLGYMTADNPEEDLGLMRLRVFFPDLILPREIEITITLLKTVNIESEFTRNSRDTFTFDLSLREFEEPKIYPIEKELIIEGKRITMDRMEVYPTGCTLHYKTWKTNQDELTLQFNVVKDGLRSTLSSNFYSTSFYDEYDEHTLRIEDNYFNQPKTRSLLISSYYFLAEDQQYVNLDVANKTLSRPIENMELLDVTHQENLTTLVFRAESPTSEPPIRFFTDEKGFRLNIIKTRYTTHAEIASYVYEIETKKTPYIMMRVSPTFTDLGDNAIEIPIPSR